MKDLSMLLRVTAEATEVVVGAVWCAVRSPESP